MKILERLFERFRNPWCWPIQLAIIVVIYYGVWSHNWIIIATALVVGAINVFFFPKPKKSTGWADRFIDGAIEWHKEAGFFEIGSFYAIHCVALAVLFYGLWVHNVALFVAAFIIAVLNKLFISRTILKRAFRAKK